MSFENSDYYKMTDAERSVWAFLSEKDLLLKYESGVYITDNKDRPRIWTPDFYLPDLGIYVEVVCCEDPNYLWRKKMYSKNKIEIIFIYYKRENWQSIILKEIKDIQQKRWEKVQTLVIE